MTRITGEPFKYAFLEYLKLGDLKKQVSSLLSYVAIEFDTGWGLQFFPPAMDFLASVYSNEEVNPEIRQLAAELIVEGADRARDSKYRNDLFHQGNIIEIDDHLDAALVHLGLPPTENVRDPKNRYARSLGPLTLSPSHALGVEQETGADEILTIEDYVRIPGFCRIANGRGEALLVKKVDDVTQVTSSVSYRGKEPNHPGLRKIADKIAVNDTELIGRLCDLGFPAEVQLDPALML